MIDNAKGPTAAQVTLTPEQLAHLGGGHIAYVKPMRSEEARRLFPQVEGIPALRPAQRRWHAHRADRLARRGRRQCLGT